MEIYFYNTLTRTKEKFEPLESGRVKMYTCGPTVYDYAQIGNWRTYVLGDLVYRVLKYNGYEVKYVMNLTDVGHLTGDNLGDADQGDDRLEKAAEREKKTAWQIADFYGQDFVGSFQRLNLIPPEIFAKATEHINEQIELIQEIQAAGFTYPVDDGIYFDVGAYEKAGHVYGRLSNIDRRDLTQPRLEPNPQKKDPRDFALWKLTPTGIKRDMEWESPWGKGFPGWHIECSAMSLKYLGDQFDLHLGGQDLTSTHHPNEIAQSQAATGKTPFVKYWLHGAFILVDGKRMGKSEGNAYGLNDVIQKGFNPLALRYFYLNSHYRRQTNFTWEALAASQKALERLYAITASFEAPLSQADPGSGSRGGAIGGSDYEEKFLAAVNDDLDLPKALSIVWDLVKSDYPVSAKKASLFKFDAVLGLGLAQIKADYTISLELTGRPKASTATISSSIPLMKYKAEVESLLVRREIARLGGRFDEADRLRREIEAGGFLVEDRLQGPKIEPKKE